jgi:hypothetical protein
MGTQEMRGGFFSVATDPCAITPRQAAG